MGPEEQVHNAYSAFYRVRNNTVTSLQSPNDITGDVPNTSISIPGNVGKQLNCSRERMKTKDGGAMVAKALGRSDRMGAKRLHTGVP